MDRSDEEELLKDLQSFDKFIEGAFATPEKLEARLSEIESRVAILTRGWRGTEEKKSGARSVYSDIVLRVRAIMFFLEQLKEAFETQGEKKEILGFLEKLLGKEDKDLKKKLKSKGLEMALDYDTIAKEYWSAIKTNVGLHFRRTIKVGVENRLRKEADETAQREMAKVKNPSWGLMKLAESGGLEFLETD